MSLIPHICGKNRIQMPNSGCDDCAIYSIDDELLESLTPLECYEPPIVDAIVCQAKVCRCKAVCNETPTCEDLGTPTWSGIGTAIGVK